MARIVWHEAGFVGIEAEIVKFMRKLGERVKNAAQGLAPVDTGALVSSIRLDMEGTNAIISANTFYAVYQEEGTGPHVITGNPWLSIEGGHPVHAVEHPGNAAVHYLKNALYSAGG